jgi:hypothetical protein
MKVIKRLAIALAGVAVAAAVGFGGVASAVPQWCVDMGGPPCKGGPGGGEEGAGNNLSLPAILTDTTVSVSHYWNPPTEPLLGTHYSYGCDREEIVDQFKYPNTSCVDDIENPTVYYTVEECTDAIQPSPCQGLPVSRIFWQKVIENDWSADSDGTGAPADVAYVDWGDAIEAVSWNERSTIRVETQPYSSLISGFDPEQISCANAAGAAGLDPEVVCRVGLQMWHVSGQGTTEQWGVRAGDLDGDGAATDVSYNYDSPFQIVNTGTAKLNLTKLVPESATCPDPGNQEPGDPPPAGPFVWTGSEWGGTCTWYDAPYAVELSVGGKYVYGYNWRMKSVELDSTCTGWDKRGYWRLTFYNNADPTRVNFLDPAAPNVAPPTVASEVRELPRSVFNTALTPIPPEPPEDDRLYRPVVDTTNNLTYIDICIKPKEKAGGGGGGRDR